MSSYTLYCKTPKYTHTFPSSQSALRPYSDPRPALTFFNTSVYSDAGSVPLTQGNLTVSILDPSSALPHWSTLTYIWIR